MLSFTLIWPISRLQTQWLMMSQIMSRIEYLVITYNILMLLLHSDLTLKVWLYWQVFTKINWHHSLGAYVLDHPVLQNVLGPSIETTISPTTDLRRYKPREIDDDCSVSHSGRGQQRRTILAFHHLPLHNNQQRLMNLQLHPQHTYSGSTFRSPQTPVKSVKRHYFWHFRRYR